MNSRRLNGSNCIESSQPSRIAGYRIGGDQSAGIQGVGFSSSRPCRRRSRRACMSWLSASANSTPTRGTWLTCCARAFSGHAASGRRLGERCAGPTQPRDHPQILAIRYILEMMVGHAVEFSKHQCLSRICGAHTAENWCGSTDSGVTTGIEVRRIRHVRLSPRDGWFKCR
jgi:hypothetical protein